MLILRLQTKVPMMKLQTILIEESSIVHSSSKFCTEGIYIICIYTCTHSSSTVHCSLQNSLCFSSSYVHLWSICLGISELPAQAPPLYFSLASGSRLIPRSGCSHGSMVTE